FVAGFESVSIWVADGQHRAGAGGTGAAKCGGNYAASLLPQQQAADHDCAQVCFLDAATNTLLEEIGSMNLLVVTDDGAVHTPELSGTILDGVTRRSVLDLCREQGRAVTERPIPLAEVLDGLRTGRVAELFACGTAAVVTPPAGPRPRAERRQARSDRAFVAVFTDHMARAAWTAEVGWTGDRVEAHGPLPLAPAAAVLLYVQEMFEGLKAYRHTDGSVL